MIDPLGQAIADYHLKKRPGKLWIHNTYGPKEEMPVSAYFRQYREMPALEKAALAMCTGSVLDIGAGAGSHALWLQDQGLAVTALEISPLSCQVMSARGVANIINTDFFSINPVASYDCLLLLMNGIGLTASLSGLRTFLLKAVGLLSPGGRLLFDSSDVAYVYEGHFPDVTKYYGEIAYRYEYKRQKSEWFHWLYIDRFTLSAIANEEGWRVDLITEDKMGQYLVSLQRT